MNFSIVFENSGDSLPFETLSVGTAEALSYYVNTLDNKNLNKFKIPSLGPRIQTAVTTLNLSLCETNQFIYELLDGYFNTYTNDEYLDQQVLNKLHSDWVNSQNLLYNIQEKRKKYNSLQTEMIHDMYPDEILTTKVATVIEKLGYKSKFDSINLNIHRLETIFENISCYTTAQEWWQFDNPYSKTLLTNDINNFSFTFHHLGRTLYNKFNSFDTNLEHDDENSYDQFLGFITINLQHPQTIALSKEYVVWCKDHNKIPSGDKFNVGNIKDLINRLTDYRKLIFENTLQNNAFSIQLHKGT